MEKMNFVRDGVTKLPPGFRFQPTDDEIVFQYLSRKIFSHPLPAQIIPEMNVFAFAPWQLPGDQELDQDKYFFSKKGGNNIDGDAGGFWKAIGSVKRIICSKRLPIVGIKKTLEFYKLGAKNNCVRTDWIMHQFCIAITPNPNSNNSTASLIRIGEWSLCRIFYKRNRTTTITHENENEDEDDMYMSDTDSSSASSSFPHSDSSIYSEVSSI